MLLKVTYQQEVTGLCHWGSQDVGKLPFHHGPSFAYLFPVCFYSWNASLATRVEYVCTVVFVCCLAYLLYVVAVFPKSCK